MLEIKTIEVSYLAQNCRIVKCSDTLEASVIDPGSDIEKILAGLNSLHADCRSIWLTHSHMDHCGAVKLLKEKTNAKLFAHENEREFRSNVKSISKMWNLRYQDFEDCPEPDEYISDGTKLVVGRTEFLTLFTPGHSPGHVCFYSKAESLVMTGDVLFRGSIGRTDLPGGDFETLMASIGSKLLSLPEETRVLSGHGSDTTIGDEKQTNLFLRGLL